MEGENVVLKKLEELDKILKTYTEEKLLFKKINIPEARLDLSTKEISGMTTEELNMWRMEIAQYLIGLQREINQHKKTVNWANSALKLYIGVKAVDCAGFTFEEKKMWAMKNDNYVKNLNTIIMTAQAYLDTLEFIPNKINTMIEVARDMIWARKREDYNENRS
jgi:hypothetical protein